MRQISMSSRSILHKILAVRRKHVDQHARLQTHAPVYDPVGLEERIALGYIPGRIVDREADATAL